MATIHGGLKAIEIRKKNEAAYEQMLLASKGDKQVFQIANFEHSTTAKIEQRLKNERVEAKRKEFENSLLSRKNQLADLYNYEMNLWRSEVLAKVQTQEDRKARILERAYALRDARESERLRIVREKYDEQWRDACDDARNLDSKAMTRYMNEQRLQQIQDKIKRKQDLNGQENNFLAEWNRQLETLARKDKEKQDLKHKIDLETNEQVKAQIQFNFRARQEHMLKTQKEEEEELARLRAEIEREESMQKQRHDVAYQRGREAMQFNIENKKIKDAEQLITKTQDKILLDYAMRKEAEAAMQEEMKRNADKDAAIQYQKYLEELMVKEAEDTAFVDEINKREEEKVWKARDDALKAREDARQYLMQAVDEGRQQQIRSKREALDKEKQEGQLFAQKFLDEAAEAIQREREAAAMRSMKNVDNRSQLQQQIDYRKYKEEMEKQETYLADKQTQYMEKLHQQKLMEQGGMVRDRRPLKKNSWYS